MMKATMGMRNWLVVVCLGWAGAMAASAAEIWVAPGGSDANPGTANRPLATPAMALRRARDLRRLKDPSIADGVMIRLHGGDYALGEALFVRPEDSGTEASPTVIAAAEGERPVLSGGVVLKGWRKLDEAVPGLPEAAAGHVWVADVPGFEGRPLEFRQLWVDGRKAMRARMPNEGVMERLSVWDRAGRRAGLPATIARPRTWRGAELVVLQMWEIAVLRVKTWTSEDDVNWLTFHEPESRVEFEHPWPQPLMNGSNGNAAFYLVNAIDFLDTPGEWYLDAAGGRLYYWPRANETMATAKVVAPALETVVRLEGTPDRPVENVTFRGIGFENTTWLRPSLRGHVPLQAGFYMTDAYSLKPKGTADWRSLDNQAWLGRPPAAVSVEGGASGIRFERCAFEQVAANGLDLGQGVRASTVEGCVFHDVGINGIVAGAFADGGIEAHLPYDPRDERVVTARLRIANNLLRDCANEDWGGVAIAAGFVRETVIAHNDIADTSYTGISLGWGWTRTANAMRDNAVTANLIRHIATRMSDTAGVYTLSNQPGTIVNRNVVDHITMSPYVHDPEHWFYLYTDEGSSHITVRDNWCPAERFLQNANGPGNVWENNGSQVDPAIKAAAGLEPEFRDLPETLREAR